MVYLLDAIKVLDIFLETIALTRPSEAKELVLDSKIPLHKNLSFCYLKQGNYEECVKECHNVLSYEPKN